MATNAVLFWLCICGSVTGPTFGQTFTREPVNTAVKEGNEARLECAGTDMKRVNWMKGQTIIYHREVDSLDIETVDGYEGDSNSPDDLIIRNTDSEKAAMYTCQLALGGATRTAGLNVMKTPVCTSPRTTFTEGAMPDLKCGVNYWGPMKPRLVWIFENREELGEVLEDSDNMTPVPTERWLSVIKQNFTIEAKHDNMPFTCRVEFSRQEPDLNPNFQDPLPEYTDECVMTFRVEYGVKEITFEPDPDNFPFGVMVVRTGESIFCNATGSAPISYQWNKDSGGEGKNSVFESELRITPDMDGEYEYTCVARNLKTSETLRKITFKVLYQSPNVAAGVFHAMSLLVAMAFGSIYIGA